MNKSLRRIVGCVAIAGMVFGQMAMAAYVLPGPADGTSKLATLAGSPVDLGGGHCAGMSPSPLPANVCEVHCTDGAALPTTPDLPPVVLTALPVELDSLATLAASRDIGRSLLAALPGAPPPPLEFCRLLI